MKSSGKTKSFEVKLFILLIIAAARPHYCEGEPKEQDIDPKAKECLEQRNLFFESCQNAPGGAEFASQLIEVDDLFK